MDRQFRYDRLPSVHESQDIADAGEGSSYELQSTTRPASSPSPPGYSPVEQQKNVASSVKSVNTYASSVSRRSGGFEKLKKIIRRKPLPESVLGSIRRHPAADIHPIRIGRGVWKDQLLVDRSLRSMALFMTTLAIAMLIVIFTHAKTFRDRSNPFSTSVGGDPSSCKSVTRANTVLLLLINIAATMILGMSNTYQQLVTSLKISDLKHMLQKFGDSRVGTNSPFSINHKESGKKSAWAAWFLLICTSMPVHFLANSLIGPSFILEPPRDVQFNETTYGEVNSYSYSSGTTYITDSSSFLCWSAFRTGRAHFAKSLYVLGQEDSTYGSGQTKFGIDYATIIVQYSKGNCTGMAKDTTDVDALEKSWKRKYSSIYYSEGSCSMGSAVKCQLRDARPAKCRLNVRMSAAFILAVCLMLKAIYMVGVNVMARGKLKKHCLTFGDVIVASASDPELRVQGECMVNANDSYRRETIHTCHKHCKSGIASMTGDELGHCQKCTKQNKVNKLPQTPQPTIATKFKKSLISNMGNTALTQMLLLMFCSFVMLFASVFVGVFVGMSYNSETKYCHEYEDYYGDEDEACRMSDTSRFGLMSGGFGGFNHSLTAATLPPDQIKSEILSFCISNGAQFIYSLLYLMLIYNITLVSQEHSWGHLEHHRKKLRCTIVRGESFSEDYLLQLPKKILFPIMVYSVLTHWMLGEALQTQEAVWREDNPDRQIEHSKYIIVYAAYPLWGATFLILLMTSACWWAYTYKREGFIPQMFGSIRTLCAATSQLDDFPSSGVMWGDLGLGKQFRHAGLSAEDTVAIEPNELYAGVGEEGERIGGKERSNDCEVRMGTEEGRRRNVGDVKKWKDFDGENWRRGS